MQARFMLCDAADVQGGKLYVMGGGWTWTIVAQPVIIGVAISIQVPWTEANVQHTLEFSLRDVDGNAVVQETPEGPKPVRADGRFGVGRPMGVREGSELFVPLAFRLGPLLLTPQRYMCELRINDVILDTLAFEGLAIHPSQGGLPQ